MKTLYVLVFALFLVSSVPLAFANPQSNSSNARITGILTDPAGKPLSGVQVTAQAETDSKAKVWTATSNEDGAYLLALPEGRYRITYSRQPFATREIVTSLTEGESKISSLRMDLEPLSSSVIVTAQTEPTREQQTTAPTDVISLQEIIDRQAVTLPDVLAYSPGVTFGRTGANGGTTSIFLNGGNSNFTKVLIDGTPINPPGGAVDFSILTLDNVDKIEVVRGAESAIYGTDAVSGVIQVFSHRGTTGVPAVSVFTEGGDYATIRTGVQISGLLGRFDYSGAASYFHTDGQGPNNDFLNRTLTGNFGYAFSDTNQLRLTVRNNNSGAGIPGQTIFEPPSLYQRINQELFSANARWDFVTGSHWHHQLMGTEAYLRQHSFNPTQSFYATDPFAFCPQSNPNAVATAEFCDFTSDSHYNYNRAGFQLQSTYVARKFAFTLGYQYEVENAYIYSLAQNHVRRNNQGGFLDLRYTPIARLIIDVGARAEDNSNFGTRVVPRAGASFVLHYSQGVLGDTLVRAFYGEGIKEPRFDQLYSDQFGDIGNPLLKPEISKTWSTGIEQKLFRDRVKINADYFSNRFYDIISFAFCSTLAPPAMGNTCGITVPNAPPSFGYYFNTDLARARGTNIAAEARATKWLFLRGNYTYDDSLVIKSPNSFDPSEIAGNRLLRRPVNSGSVTATGTFRRFSATLAGYFMGQRTDSDFLGLGYTRDPGYSRFDASASYQFPRGFALYARATNILDKQYQDALGYPALGRDAIVGVRYQFAGRN
ncbi:MAG TPA: TonB-dependent receptor [Candidatus Acidoferrum sp.]